MEEEPVMVPSQRGQPPEARNEGGEDEGSSSHSSSSDGVLVSPSSSPGPQQQPAPPSSSLPASSPSSVSAGQGMFRIDTYGASELTPGLLKEIRSIHERCFPEEKEESEDDDAWLQRATFCHEPSDCVWILLYEIDQSQNEDETSTSTSTSTSTVTSTSTSTSSSSSFLASWLPSFFSSKPTPTSAAEKKEKRKEELVGLVTGVPYSTSLFGFNLGVLPRMRSRGLGVRLMHSLQAAALARFGLGAISATVDAEKKGLVEYYRGHGGVVESAGVTSPDSSPPTVVRIVKRFDAAELLRVTREADEKIRELAERRKRRRSKGVVVAAAAAAAVLAMAALALALLRGRSRRRLLK